MVDGFLEELRDMVVVEGVGDGASGPLAVDEPEAPQHPQLVGDRGLFHLDRFGELTDGGGAFPGKGSPSARVAAVTILCDLAAHELLVELY